MSHSVRRIMSLVACALTVGVLLFGMSHFGMSQHLQGQVSNCTFVDSHGSVCNASSVEHLQEWQRMFTILPSADTMLLAFILAAILGLLGSLLAERTVLPTSSRDGNFIGASRFSSLEIFDPLEMALSSGILNPKLF